METRVSLKYFVNDCGFWTLKLTVSQARTDGTDFLHVHTILHKLKGD